jgi:hypothetical protein
VQQEQRVLQVLKDKLVHQDHKVHKETQAQLVLKVHKVQQGLKGLKEQQVPQVHKETQEQQVLKDRKVWLVHKELLVLQEQLGPLEQLDYQHMRFGLQQEM